MRVIDVTPLPARAPARRARQSNLWAVTAAALVFGSVSWRLARASVGAAPPVQAAALAPALPRGELRAEELATIELFKRSSPGVVHITNAARVHSFMRDPVDIPVGTGTGFVWDDQGHIVTNYHVVRQQTNSAPRFFVRFAEDQAEYEADIVGVAPHKDLAVLRLSADPPRRMRAVKIGSSADLQVGQQVFAIGNPFGLDQTLTTGIISGLGRSIRSITEHKISGVIQTDAAINPGNSGGPLLDSSGRVIGVNTAIVSPSGAYSGIGFAVPIDTVRRFVPELIDHGRVSRPGLGVTLLEARDAAALGLTGVGILQVAKGSAADEAGLRSLAQVRGGYLVDEILAVDGVDVRSQQDLFDVLDEKEIGELVQVKLRRGSQVSEVQVALMKLDE